MSGGYDQRGSSTIGGGNSAVADVGGPGKSTMTVGALPRTTADVGPISSSAAQGDPVAVLRAMIARGDTSPDRLAGVLRANPAASRELTAVLDQKFGPAYTGFVVGIAQDGARAPSSAMSGAPAAAAVASVPSPSEPAAAAFESEPAIAAATQPAVAEQAAAAQPQNLDVAAVAPAKATAAAPGPAAEQAPDSAPAAGKQAASDVTLEDPALVDLAAKIHDPKLAPLLTELAGVLVLNQKLRATRSPETRFEVKGKDRAVMVDRIGVVRAQLAALGPSEDPNVTAFRITVNHRLEEIAPYHFQLNIPTIESPGGWSTCNLTSLAMCLEVLGIGASTYPTNEHKKLLAVASVFKADIAKARLATDGTDASLSSLMGLRFPDFLELAAVVEFVTSAEPQHDEIVAAAVQAVGAKLQGSFLKRMARKFGAPAKDKSIQWDSSKKSEANFRTNQHLNDYGSSHRGNGSHGVEQLSTARNIAEKETDPKKKAAADKRYEALVPKQQAALDGDGIEHDLGLQAYKSAVIRELTPELDAGRGVIAGLYMHWTRLYAIDGDHILVQDPGAWNRTEINLTWAEARAMGYFWATIVVG